MNTSWYVYIITNHANTVLYTGITNNLQRRVYEHKKGVDISSFSKKYHLYKLLWYEEFPSPIEAISIEKKIKGWKRYKKIDLIKTMNPLFINLMKE